MQSSQQLVNHKKKHEELTEQFNQIKEDLNLEIIRLNENQSEWESEIPDDEMYNDYFNSDLLLDEYEK